MPPCSVTSSQLSRNRGCKLNCQVAHQGNDVELCFSQFRTWTVISQMTTCDLLSAVYVIKTKNRSTRTPVLKMAISLTIYGTQKPTGSLCVGNVDPFCIERAGQTRPNQGDGRNGLDSEQASDVHAKQFPRRVHSRCALWYNAR